MKLIAIVDLRKTGESGSEKHKQTKRTKSYATSVHK